MSGVVQGGWEFVIAAYSITALGLLVYGLSLFMRLREARSRAGRTEGTR
jgi:hypothetical protein